MASGNSLQIRPISDYHWVQTEFTAYNGATVTTPGSYVSAQSSTFLSVNRAIARTPNYRAIIASGGVLPDNPMSFEKIEGGHRGVGTLTYLSRRPNGDFTQWVYTSDSEGTYVPFAAKNPWNSSAHTTRLLKKAKGAEWSAPVFLAESGKTAAMVYQAATRITSMFVALRKGNFVQFVSLWHKSASKRLDSSRKLSRASKKFGRQFGRNPREAVGSAWLEYKYGWTPFVLDTYNAFETLTELQAKPSSKIGRVTSRLTSKSVVVTKNSSNLVGIIVEPFGGTRTVTHELSSQAVWKFVINENLNFIGKLGLTNPLSVGWELLPLSFVADWFLPIGDYIAALDAPMRFSHSGGQVGFKCVSTSKVVINSKPFWTVSNPSFKEGSSTTVTVQPMTGSPSIKLLDNAISANLQHGRAVSALALLSGAFKGR